MEVHWKAKSGSVARVIQAWNVGADSVVFVDDSPMELAEVKAAVPEVECLLFPKDDYRAFGAFLRRLRDTFGKPHISTEDAARRESLRQASHMQEEMAAAGSSESFLSGLNASISIETSAASDPRSLDLINKTNQFNLNGRRYEAGEWQESTRRPGSFVWSVSYRDKFGALGTIAVIHGCAENGRTIVHSWVMSCRAFARRIEHQSLKALFERTGAGEIELAFEATARNGPLAEFLSAVCDIDSPPPLKLNREAFLARCAALYQELEFR
jgi:FkbH-like protein